MGNGRMKKGFYIIQSKPNWIQLLSYRFQAILQYNETQKIQIALDLLTRDPLHFCVCYFFI